MPRRKLRLDGRFKNLFRNPFFWALTLVGNGILLSGSFLLWTFEGGSEGTGLSFFDCVLWSAGMVTTIGYGNITAQTLAGKFVVLGLMLFGTLFVWSYMAFLVTGLIAPELALLEREVHDFEKELKEAKGSEAQPWPSSRAKPHTLKSKRVVKNHGNPIE